MIDKHQPRRAPAQAYRLALSPPTVRGTAYADIFPDFNFPKSLDSFITADVREPFMKKYNYIHSTLALTGVITCSAQDTGEPVSTPPPEKPKWTRSAALGATLTGGNSDTVLITGNVNATRKWDQHEILLGADAAYGEVENQKNADSVHGMAQYNRLFSERLYGYARLDALHDAIADVDYRFTFGPGAGYYFIKNATTSLSGELGPSFVYEKVGAEDHGYFALRIGEKFEHKLSDRARIWQSFEILPQVDNFENFIANAEIGVESKLTTDLSLRVFVQDTYDNEPAPGRKKNDVKLVSALAYTF
jgi:putative salt-induced outer membrane protein